MSLHSERLFGFRKPSRRPPCPRLTSTQVLLRRVLIGGLAALALAAPAAAQTQTLMPGVTFERGVQFTPHGPVALNVVRGPRPSGLYALRPVLSNDAILGTETLTQMQKRLSSTATMAGVNGDFFAFDNGRPSGIVMADRVVVNPPYGDRSSTGVTDDGTLDVRRVEFFGTWRGLGQRRVLNDLNQVPGPNGISLFTNAWGPATPQVDGAVQLVLSPFPPTNPNTDLAGPVTQVLGGGSVGIPAGGAVLVARGTAAQRLVEEAPVGSTLTLRLILRPEWSNVANAIGGGPVLVRGGGPVFRANEAFTPAQLVPRNPRTAVGQTADGRVLLVTTDGRLPGYSVGMTNFELAQTMVRLGAVRASALDAGGSTAMAFEGQLLNRPSQGERPLANSLQLMYYGVYLPPPAEPVLSLNDDGVAERQELAFKVVRPSTVTASLVGPDGTVAWTETSQRNPGTYQVAFPPAPPPPPPADPTQPPPTTPPPPPTPPAPPAEGRWRLDVAATDDLGRASTGSQSFTVDNTLGSLSVTPARLVLRAGAGQRLTIAAEVTRAATLTAIVETRAGARVRVLTARATGPGAVTLQWDGKILGGRLFAYRGSYLVRLRARSEIGVVELSAPFTVQRPVVRKAKPKPKARGRAATRG